jgi:hypothetical protein
MSGELVGCCRKQHALTLPGLCPHDCKRTGAPVDGGVVWEAIIRMPRNADVSMRVHPPTRLRGNAGNPVNEMAVEMKAVALEEMNKEEVKCGGGVILSDPSVECQRACALRATDCLTAAIRVDLSSDVLSWATSDDVSRGTRRC